MANISNREILELLEERDKKSVYHTGEISRSFNRGNVGKLYEINCLIQCLRDDNYILTDSDIELLREYNIFTVKKSKSRSKDSFIAISDFHGFDYPIHKILNHYLEEYEYIYILGDATDRGPYGDGTGSIDVLRMIKKLSELYPGRVIYVPGNHDSFIVGHDKGDVISTLSMKKNKGSKTYEELELLKKKTGRKPIFLLDDVFSELDDKRQEAFLSEIIDVQTFISCVDIDTFKYNKNKASLFKIKNGSIVL